MNSKALTVWVLTHTTSPVWRHGYKIHRKSSAYSTCTVQQRANCGHIQATLTSMIVDAILQQYEHTATCAHHMWRVHTHCGSHQTSKTTNVRTNTTAGSDATRLWHTACESSVETRPTACTGGCCASCGDDHAWRTTREKTPGRCTASQPDGGVDRRHDAPALARFLAPPDEPLLARFGDPWYELSSSELENSDATSLLRLRRRLALGPLPSALPAALAAEGSAATAARPKRSCAADSAPDWNAALPRLPTVAESMNKNRPRSRADSCMDGVAPLCTRRRNRCLQAVGSVQHGHTLHRYTRHKSGRPAAAAAAAAAHSLSHTRTVAP